MIWLVPRLCSSRVQVTTAPSPLIQQYQVVCFGQSLCRSHGHALAHTLLEQSFTLEIFFL